ncbi:response regulator transcription factor [Alcaligenaceae bacterium B3P038]|nr:response regulator transcription factor [Alcaligenaceae bacterium B3P038]
MSTNRVALLEDNPRMAALICKALSAAGIPVDVFERIDSAWQAIAPGGYAALVIDRSVPDGDGLDLVKRLRARGNATPCLMVTARDAIHDRIQGLESGADDYLPKPFSLEEFVARVRALMRRPVVLASLNPSFGGLTVHPDMGCMTHGPTTVPLPPAELQILLALVQAAGQVIRRSRLEATGWGLGEGVTPNALDVAVHRLRRKIASAGAAVQIVNLRGQGFALQAIDETQ